METHNDQQIDSSLRRTTINDITEEDEQQPLEVSRPETPTAHSTIQQEQHINHSSSGSTTEVTEATSTIPTPTFTERKRNNFSYNANELRRRTASTSSSQLKDSTSSGTTCSRQKQTSTTTHNTNSDDGFYECNICFDTATYPVLTLCGHLFCWSCLGQWLNAQSRNPTCPVCKAGCGKDKVIPIYGRGREEKDPRNDPSIPTRPAGQRPPPLRDPNRPGTTFFGQNPRGGTYNSRNVTFTGGIGLFPLGISFNFPFNGPPTEFQSQAQQNAFMSRLFLMVLSLVIVAIIFY
ncbi:hypothetical protein BCR42DRAFT_425145 [Absidia repens]|uniref:RING-type E3 ubiquitin transferase n=1 Tax=Absidia repens TaxID=90262 RepID=A0A1X2I3C8_9FUNG|nr:hypothetical protein BCR42DRAFT_425145 [Absidia repens]